MPLISPHDGVGTQLYGHVLRGRLMRVVPRAVRGDQRDLDRRSRPLQLRGRLQRRPAAERRWCAQADGSWREVDWDEALAQAAQGLQGAARTPGSGVLAQSLEHARGAVSAARLARGPGQRATSIIACGSAIFATRRPMRSRPGLGHADRRGRCSSMRCWSSARTCAARCRCSRTACARPRCAARSVSFINPARFEYLFPVHSVPRRRPRGMVADLAAVLRRRSGGAPAAPALARAARERCARRRDAHRARRRRRCSRGERRAMWLGALAARMQPLRGAARAGARAGRSSPAPPRRARRGRQRGRRLSGRRGAAPRGGRRAARAQPGLQRARRCSQQPLPGYLLLDVEPWADACADPRRCATLARARAAWSR